MLALTYRGLCRCFRRPGRRKGGCCGYAQILQAIEQLRKALRGEHLNLSGKEDGGFSINWQRVESLSYPKDLNRIIEKIPRVWAGIYKTTATVFDGIDWPPAEKNPAIPPRKEKNPPIKLGG
jgi:hypothetical protein